MDIHQKLTTDLSGRLCTVGAAVFAIGAAKEPISRFVTLPSVAFTACMIAGGMLVIVGAIAFVAPLVIEPFRMAVSVIVYRDTDARYICSFARTQDLPQLHALYESYFGADTPAAALMRKWLKKAPAALTIVERVIGNSRKSETRELVGSFKVLPLTRTGQQAIEMGKATGSTLEGGYIAGPRSRPAAYYVGDVVATTRVARGIVMAQLEFALPTKVDEPVIVYARPLTPDGLRVMTKHGFVLASDAESLPKIRQLCKLQVGPKNTVRTATRQRKAKRLAPKPMLATARDEQALHATDTAE